MRRRCFINITPNLLFLGLLLAAQWLAFPVFAQTYSYRHYTVEDGLPTNYVYGGLQDSRGYIWFYTEKGVSRFDGYEFRNFTTEDGLPTNDVWQLVEDSQGRMWVGCFGGKFVAIDKDSVVVINQDSTAVTQTKINRANGKIWVYVKGAQPYAIIDNEQKADIIFQSSNKQLCTGKSALGVDITPYVIDYGKQLYFIHDPAKVIVAHPRKKKLDTFRIKGLTEELAQRFRNSYNVGYLCHNNQLFLAPPKDRFVYNIDLNKKALSSRNVAKILGKPPTYCQFQEQGDKVIFQTDIGCILFDNNFTVVDALIVDFTEQQSVSKIFTDREGNYWIPTREQGVYLLTAQAKRTKVIKAFGENATPALTDLAFSPDGHLYAGSQHGTIYRLEDDRMVEAIPAPSLPLNDLQRVRKLIFTESGTLWTARQKYGLHYFSPDQEKGWPFNRVVAAAEINTLSDQINQFSSPRKRYMISNLERNIKDLAWHEASKRLYVARSAYGFIYQAASDAKPQLKFISPQRNHAAHFTSDGTLWMGLKQGLANYREDRYKKINTHTMIDKRAVFCFTEDAQGRLWLGTDGAGIFTQQKDEFIQIPGTEGLIVQDLCIKGGTVWGATNKGIWQIGINPSGGAGIVEEIYNTSHGLPSLEIMAVEANDHYVYAATSKGLAQLQLNRPPTTDEEIALIIDQVKINGEKVALDSVYQLDYQQNEIEVNFTALSYKSQGNITYFYQLENADRKTLSTSNRRLRYGGLKPGIYTLRIFARDAENRRSPVKRIQFNIALPWWQRPAALIVGVLTLGLLAWAAYRRRVHQIQQQAESETALNKQFAELELKALQAQMNPHFVFNSLSAIQYFIQINEKEQAEDYLAKFATLMRLFLESSKNKYINLTEELRLIELYVRLEQLRFRSQFGFNLQVDPSINQYTTLVPTMLLQPFVENAINHGLFHKKEQGTLSVSILPHSDGGLRCLVEDNGIGRQQAMAIQKQNQRHHRSRALQITNERLQALSTVEGYDIKIEITDLISAAGEAAGTRVEIIIPTIE